MKRIPQVSAPVYVYGGSVLFVLGSAVYSGKHLDLISRLSSGWFARHLERWLETGDLSNQAIWAFGFGVLFFLLGLGIKPYLEFRKYQKAIDCLALKNGIGTPPKLCSIRANGPHRLRLLIRSEGIGTEHYESKKSDLKSAFGAAVEDIQSADNPKYIEITLAKRKIPETCNYRDLTEKIKKTYAFLIGESIGGTLFQSIRDLPHMLIAGTTGGGKSVFFKQVILCLMHTSQRLQMYLLDLKGGVEMKEFSELPNVAVAKNERDAVFLLRRIKAEMDSRFKYMEEKGYKKIEPERDKMDLIVVGVDEASVLYTQTGRRAHNAELIEEARRLTDDLAKLARAAGIHLILATQKVTKETIDTKIQENIGGRMCFRMNTLQGSLTVLGNKMAFELPDKPGRAIWAAGNDFIEVQAPFISDEEIVRECELIKFDFEQGKRQNYQDMLTYDDVKKSSGPSFDQVAA